MASIVFIMTNWFLNTSVSREMTTRLKKKGGRHSIGSLTEEEKKNPSYKGHY